MTSEVAEEVAKAVDEVISKNEDNVSDKERSKKGHEVITEGEKAKKGEKAISKVGKGRNVKGVLEGAAGAAGVEVGETKDGLPTVKFPDGSRATGYPEASSTGEPSM